MKGTITPIFLNGKRASEVWKQQQYQPQWIRLQDHFYPGKVYFIPVYEFSPQYRENDLIIRGLVKLKPNLGGPEVQRDATLVIQYSSKDGRWPINAYVEYLEV